MADTHMEELAESSGAMAHEGGGSRLSYHSEPLLAPETDFMTDDRSSANSGMDVADRLTYLEQRVQMQEDEIQLLKITLADVLKRLNISEEQTAALHKKGPVKVARPVSLALPPRPSSSGSTGAGSQRKATTVPSTSSRNYSPSTSKRSPVGKAKDSPGSASGRTSTTTTTCRKVLESTKSKETGSNVAGTRRVTHCKVTMQIFLSPLSRRTGSSEPAVAITIQPNTSPPNSGSSQTKGVSDKTKATVQKNPEFTLLMQKTSCRCPSSPVDNPSYKSPVKSPSQYFQICY
ncbi:putative protein TPRXL [Chanos chanos]|uniref:Echinoderm microtubule-associated protein-like 1 n=1 Tax=Chanos chanos TaxID=29144 RepID=A0A6J2V9Y0_CHACN|nr:putative protein TPRXL [Chanos chanos]